MTYESNTPFERLIQLRGKQKGTYLRRLLEHLDAPPNLRGLLRISENLLAITKDQEGAVALSDDEETIDKWKTELSWIISNRSMYENKLFDVEDAQSFSRREGQNPVLRYGATTRPIYARLWDIPQNDRYIRKFRVLQGQLFYASLAIKRNIAQSDWRLDDEKMDVARAHLYNSSLSLAHVVKQCDRKDKNEEYITFLSAIPYGLRLDDFGARIKEQRETFKLKDDLYKDLGLLLSLFNWAIYGKYNPYPRGQQGGTRSERNQKGKTDDIENNFIENAHFELRVEDDDKDIDGDDCAGHLPRANVYITPYRRLRRAPGQQKDILNSGDNPDNYMLRPSIDLSVNARGVCLDTGGWREMRNQYLPWTLQELTDEELGITLQRLEKKLNMKDPQSFELLALVHAALWTGRPLKSILSLTRGLPKNINVESIALSCDFENRTATIDKWHIRALALPYSEEKKRSVNVPGARQSIPVFTLCSKTPVNDLLTIQNRLSNGSVHTNKIFERNIAEYKKRFSDALSCTIDSTDLNDLSRATIDRIGHVLFQRIIDLTGGDMVAASLITGRNIDVARVDRFYASPSVASLQKIYSAALASIRDELKSFNLEFSARDSVDSVDNDDAVGSTLCPKEETVKSAVAEIRTRVTDVSGGKRGTAEEVHNQHNYYALWSVLTVGWSVGFRAVADPFIYESEADLVSGLTAFQDKGPADKSKTRLMALPDFVLAQIRDCCSYLRNTAENQYDVQEHLGIIGQDGESRPATPSALQPLLKEFGLAPANVSRHFGRTQLIEKDVSPEYISAWLGHFFRGEEPWGKYSTFRYLDYCNFMRSTMTSFLTDLGFIAIGTDGKRIAAIEPEVERFRRNQKTRNQRGKRAKRT